MKIVIDIDEKNYMSCQTSEYARKSIYFDLVYAIRNGIILPKGHGRLIDADALDKDCESSEYHEAITSWLDLAPTIIESNKGSEVDK